MESEAKALLLNSITEVEYGTIEDSIRKKIENLLNEHINDFLTAKAYFATTRASNEEKVKTLEEQLRVATQEKDDIKIKFDALQTQFDETNKSLTAIKNQLNKANDDIKKLEQATDKLRRERNDAVDENQTLNNMLARRETELERLRSDVSVLNSELKAAITAKCEAIALTEDVQSKQIDLTYKEKMLESERELLNKQMVGLSADLSHANNELTKQRRESTNKIVTLQTTISENEEELRILKEQKNKLQQHNNELIAKLDSLSDRLREQKADEEKLIEGLQQQLHAQTKLADIYKERLAESEAHSAELGGAVRELQRLLQEASNQYGELETRLNQNEQDAAATLLAKQEAIKALKEELKHANLLLEAVKQESSEAAVSRLSPMAASASKLLKSGLTLTQLYTKYAEVTRELIVEKNEKENLKAYVETVLKEIEEKAPIILRQKEEYEFALSSMETLKQKVNDLEEEHAKLKQTATEAQTSSDRLKHYNKRLQETVKDLSRQICYLLREVEAARGNHLPLHNSPPELLRAEMKTCSDVIGKHLVTFSGVEELKLINLRLLVSLLELSSETSSGENKANESKRHDDVEVMKKYLVKFESVEQLQLINLQLLASLKELSAEKEREEMEREDNEDGADGRRYRDSRQFKDLQDELARLDTKVEALEEREKFLMKQVEVIKNQRDVYHKLFLKQKKGATVGTQAEISRDEENTSMEILDETPVKLNQSGENTSNPVKEESKQCSGEMEARRLIEDLRKEYETYRQERTANEKLLVETVDKLRSDLSSAVKDRAELASRAEYNQATCDRLKNKLKALEIERDALEKRCSNYAISISNLEGNLRRVSNEAVESLNKLSIAEVTLANLKEENSFLKQNESRFLKERESQRKEKHGQELLMTTLEALKVKFECSETEAKLKLESRLDDANNELSALRRRLQEEQDRLTQRMELLEKQTNTAKQRLEEEIALRQKTKDELEVSRTEVKERDQRIEALSEQLRVAINQSQPVLDRENKIKQLEDVIRQKDSNIKGLEDQLEISKKSLSELSEVSQGIEKHLAEITEQYDSYKEDAEKKISDLQAVEVELRANVRNLEVRLKTMHASEAEERAARDAELSNLRTRVESLGVVLNDAKERALKAETEAREAADGTRAAEQRSEKLACEKNNLAQELDNLRSHLSKVESELGAAQQENTSLKETLEIERKSFQEKVKLLSEQVTMADEKINDLTKANDLLHDQIQEFGVKVSVYNTSANSSISFNADESLDADALKQSDKLLEVLRLMRKEKSSANVQYENLRSDKLRLEAEVEILKSQLGEMKKTLQQERTSSDTPTISAEKHAQFLNKMETLNQLTENNKTLLDDKKRLEEKIGNLEGQLSSIENELIQPSKQKISELEVTMEQLSTENIALKAENQRWQDRTNHLIERNNKNPDELKRLTQEKENLSKQLSFEKEQSKLTKTKLEEQLAQIRREKEESVTSLTAVEKNLLALRQELNTTKDSLKETADKLAQMEAEIAAKDVNLLDIRSKETQIRQIAKKYKAQCQELTKTLDDERKLRDEAGPSIPPETEEKLKSLTEQVTVMQRENEALQRENDTLKAGTMEREDRAKTLLKNARNRIQQLSEENKALKEVSDIRGVRAKAGEGSSTSADSRNLELKISRLEKEKEEEQIEKERLLRELEVMTQRMSAVQRQLDKQQSLTSRQGAKPSTSSADKSTSDPPTANIKPMAGPSTSCTKQAQTQHAVTVTPWRETPFASIRPMSQQTRTVVVQPTSQTAASAQTCSQPPLGGRQQQVVHTSSDGLSSSPTSSHMDYIPAVSSAVHNILHPNVILGQHIEAEADQAEDSGPIAPAHCVQPAVSIALVLPQPAPQAQDHHHHHDQTGEAVSIENSGVVSASNQEQVNEQSVSASNHGSGAAPTGYYREESGTGGVASSESSSTPGGSTGSNVVGAVSGGVPIAGASGVGTAATSQQAASSTTSVTTSVAQQAPLAKRPHHEHPDHDKHLPPMKRSRIAGVGEATGGEMLLRSDGLEVEYQVPTSSQRDHEDDILVTSDGDESPKALEDGQDFEEEVEEEARYDYVRDSQDLLYGHHEEVQEADMHILDENSSMDQDNNEVEIIEDSNEVPNTCESSPLVGGSSGPSNGSGPSVSEEPRVSVAGSAGGSGAEAATSSLGQVTSNQYPSRRPTAMPILNRHHVSLSYDDPGDDSIVPSTPTLYVPRRSDGFCETVSSPHVPPVRFTFSQDHPNNNMSSNQAVVAGVAQVASEGMDDTRMDLSQLDEGTGRSVPTTPSLVSPQESTVGSEPGRIDDSVLVGGPTSIDNDAAVVTVPDTPLHDQKKDGEKSTCVAGGSGTAGTSASTSIAGGTTSEPLIVVEDEEGREAEASTAAELGGGTSSSSSVVVTATAVSGRSTGSTRRPVRVAPGSRSLRSRAQPTPIIWQIQDAQQSQQQQQQVSPQQTVTMLPIRAMRNRPMNRAVGTSGIDRGAYRLRARRGVRGGFHPGGNFQNQPRF